jgi:glycosyltransferase involved in cell wall biosynthesis
MIVAFVSNFLNHHQLPLCEAFLSHPNVEFYFISSEPVPKSEIRVGYDDLNDKKPFVIKEYESKTAFEKADNLVCSKANLVIFGSGDRRIKNHLDELKKPYFLFSEHINRNFVSMIKMPISIYKNFYLPSRNGCFFLCASSHLPAELSNLGLFNKRLLYWGYFPNGSIGIPRESGYYPVNGNQLSILFTGRLISLKRPYLSIEILRIFLKRGIDAKLTILGEGPELSNLKNRVQKLGLTSNVVFNNFVNNKKVSGFMLKSDIFIFPSTKGEGWGAVLSEAMSAGCCCIASRAAGSTDFLIEDGSNGFSFSSVHSLRETINQICFDPSLIGKCGRNAKETMKKTWNANKAVDNLLLFFQTNEKKYGKQPGNFLK